MRLPVAGELTEMRETTSVQIPTTPTTPTLRQALEGQAQRQRDTEAVKMAKAWYKIFRGLAYQAPLPMVIVNPKWRDLPDWYQLLLITTAQIYLGEQDAMKMDAS